MSTEGLIISLVILTAGLLLLAQPFMRRAAAPKGAALAQVKEREVLLTSYERILTTLRELDEDYQLGKLPPDAYAVERDRWAEKGTAVLQQLEKLTGYKPAKASKTSKKSADADAALDAAIEQAIANYVQAKSAD